MGNRRKKSQFRRLTWWGPFLIYAPPLIVFKRRERALYPFGGAGGDGAGHHGITRSAGSALWGWAVRGLALAGFTLGYEQPRLLRRLPFGGLREAVARPRAQARRLLSLLCRASSTVAMSERLRWQRR